MFSCCKYCPQTTLHEVKINTKATIIVGIIALVAAVIFKSNSFPKLSVGFGGIGLACIAVALCNCQKTQLKNENSAVRNEGNHSPSHGRFDAPLFPCESPSADLSVFNRKDLGNNKELRLAAGNHTCKQLQTGKNVNLKTTGPVYWCPKAKFGKMGSPGCLVMSMSDFLAIQNVVHKGAFGGEGVEIGDNLVAIWKIPADVNQISGWVLSSKITQHKVGNVRLTDDTVEFLEQGEKPPLPDNNKSTHEKGGEKTRVDVPGKPSVHHLVETAGGQGRWIAAFSCGNLFNDFNNPTLPEKAKVAQLLNDLNGLGIKAFMCNKQHHLLVLYQNEQGEQLTPEAMAHMLQGSNGAAIKAAFAKAGKVGGQETFDVETWAESFITCYDPVSKDYIGQQPARQNT